MPHFLNHKLKQDTQQIPFLSEKDCSIELFEANNFKSPSNYHEYSPSFCTDENHHFNLQFGNSSSFMSKQSSVQEIGQVFCDVLATDKFQDFNHHLHVQNIEKKSNMIENIQDDLYTPTLLFYQSYDPSVEMISSKKFTNFSSNHSNLFESKNFYLPQTFVPDIKSLTEHVNFLEQLLYFKSKDFLRMKNFCEAVIASIKTLLSEQIGFELEKYMKEQFKFSEITELEFSKQEDPIQSYPSKLSKEFISKINSESLSYSMDLNSKQLSKSLQEIFTLGSSKFIFNKNESLKLDKKEMNSKSTEKKKKNFKKNKPEKENILDQAQFEINDRKFQQNKKKTKKPTQICIKNESMKFLMDEYASTKNSSSSTPRNQLIHQIPTIATELLCEICSRSFQPNQFFRHLSKCTNFHESSISSLKSTQKLTFNYTIMMEKLFGMREEIESQIEFLQKSKQKSKQKSEREKLKKKLEEDLGKVIRIIEEKQKQMQIHLSKNIECNLMNPVESLKKDHLKSQKMSR